MVSVIIPVYKTEQYILSCLQSFEKQIYKDFELICVDDGSPDHSGDIIQKYQKNTDMKITYVRTENHGVSYARNYGIELAQGEYICFVDSDDMVSPHYLKILIENLTEHHADSSICRSFNIADDAVTADSTIQNTVVCYDKVEVLNKLLNKEIKVGIWGVLCKRSVLGDMRFATGYAYSEDLEMLWKIAAKSNTAVVSTCELYGYRIRRGSAMEKMDDRRLDGMKLFLGLESFFDHEVPEFAGTYRKFGVGRWLWATLWQEAVFAQSYDQFCKSIEKYHPVPYMKKMISFPEFRVRASSFLFVHFRRMYFRAVKIAMRKYRKS